MKNALRNELLAQGAAVVGFACLKGHMSGEISPSETAVSIAVDRRLNEDTLTLLMKLQKRTVRLLKSRAHRTLAIPPDSDRKKGTFISKLYSLFNHKMAATSAGHRLDREKRSLDQSRFRPPAFARDGPYRCSARTGHRN